MDGNTRYALVARVAARPKHNLLAWIPHRQRLDAAAVFWLWGCQRYASAADGEADVAGRLAEMVAALLRGDDAMLADLLPELHRKLADDLGG